MRRQLRSMIPLLVLPLLAGPRWALAQSAPSADSVKHMAIRRLLSVQRTDSLMLTGVEQAMSSDEPQDPNLPPAFRQEFLARVRRDIGVFVERLVPVYDSLYSADEVNQLINFYQTPIGRRLLETQARLTASLAELGRVWGMEVAGQVLVDLARRPARP